MENATCTVCICATTAEVSISINSDIKEISKEKFDSSIKNADGTMITKCAKCSSLLRIKLMLKNKMMTELNKYKPGTRCPLCDSRVFSNSGCPDMCEMCSV